MTPKYRRLLFLGRKKNVLPLPALLDTVLALRAAGSEVVLDESIAKIVGETAAAEICAA